MQFPHATILHLAAVHSDHKPLLFNSNPSPHPLLKPFKFEAMWIDHPDTALIIQAAWSQGSSLPLKIKNTKAALKTWNRTVFGNIHQKIQQLHHHIQELQQQAQTPQYLLLEQAISHELDKLEKREVIFWKEKAKARWIEDGDHNTHYFHVTTLIHRRYNQINYLLNSDHSWISDRHLIGGTFEAYFQRIFASVHPVCPNSLQDIMRPTITADMNTCLMRCPTGSDISQALFSMGNYKSPGPDGMTVAFYKHYWGIIHETVIKEIQDVFVHGRIKPSFNHTFLALIPKTKGAARVEHFRPIALCNVSLKIITKLIAGRLRPYLAELIHPSQAAFIPHRTITDNIIINHEVLRYMQMKHGATGFMAIKIDLAKAYDRVEWNVLSKVMACLGFATNFIHLVIECLTTARFSILLNGSPYGYFAAERGLRQGDPLSPVLFTIFSDILSRLLARAEDEGKLSGIKIARTSPKITHLMYADDVVIYGKATEHEAAAIHELLLQYTTWTGKELNWDKSSIHFRPNTCGQHRNRICALLGINECSQTGKYLGHSFCKFSSQRLEFQGLVEKLKSKLCSWKRRSLSMAGRTTLIKSILQALPSYTMQTFLLPKCITTTMDRIMKNFFWGFNLEEHHRLHLQSWRHICRPKDHGGVGIRRIRDLNMAMKLNWTISTTPSKLWVQLIRSRYLRGRRNLDFEQTNHNPSWIWGASPNVGLCSLEGLAISFVRDPGGVFATTLGSHHCCSSNCRLNLPSHRHIN